EYAGWPQCGPAVTLKDQFRNYYNRLALNSAGSPSEGGAGLTIAPGQTVSDLIVFETIPAFLSELELGPPPPARAGPLPLQDPPGPARAPLGPQAPEALRGHPDAGPRPGRAPAAGQGSGHQQRDPHGLPRWSQRDRPQGEVDELQQRQEVPPRRAGQAREEAR